MNKFKWYRKLKGGCWCKWDNLWHQVNFEMYIFFKQDRECSGGLDESLAEDWRGNQDE